MYLSIGGAGYVGSFLTHAPVFDAATQIRVLDNLSTGNRFAVQGRDFVKVDLRNTQALAEIVVDSNADGVFHFAARSLVGESNRQPLEYYDNNVAGTVNLIEACRLAGIDKIVFSSTAAIYGLPEKTPIEEPQAQNPINVYGRSKQMVEQILADAFNAYGISSVSLRYFNAAGGLPDGSLGEAHEPETHLIPSILRNLADGNPKVRIFGDDYDTPDGTCIRDYIHVIDLADAHWLAMNWLDTNSGAHAFNLGTGQGFSVKQIIDSCEAVTGITVDREILPRRQGDPDVLIASAAAAEQHLGWRARHSDIETIIASAWAWHKGDRHG